MSSTYRTCAAQRHNDSRKSTDGGHRSKGLALKAGDFPVAEFCGVPAQHIMHNEASVKIRAAGLEVWWPIAGLEYLGMMERAEGCQVVVAPRFEARMSDAQREQFTACETASEVQGA